MARFFQYQNRTQAPPGASPATQQLSWFQAWSEPPVKTRIAPRLAIALMVSGLFAPITPQFFAGTGTAVASQSPVSIQYQQQFQYQAKTEPVPFPAQSSSYTYPWSEPIRVKVGLPAHQQQVLAWNTTTPAAAVVSDIRWYEPWVDPVIKKQGLGAYLQDTGAPDVPNPLPVLASQWSYPWSEPVRIKQGLRAQLQDTAAPDISLPPPILASQWIYGWSEPVRLKIGLPAYQQQVFAWNTTTPAAAASTVATSALSSPVFFKGRMIYQSVAQPVFVAGDITNVGKWFEPWSEPTRIKTTAHQQQSLAWSTFTPATAVVNLGWLQPLSVLPSQKTIVSTATFIFMAIDNALTNFWYAPWPDFTKAKTSILAAQQQTLAWADFTPAVVAFTDIRWFTPWSEPVRTLKFSAAQQQSFTQNIFPIPPAAINDVRWLIPWAEPVRTKSGLSAALQKATADFPEFPTLPATPVVNTATGSEVFYRGKFIYQSFTKPYVPPTPEVITADKWAYPWSEPVRIRQGLQVDLQRSFTGPELPQPTPVISVAGSPVIYPQWVIYSSESTFVKFLTPEIITADKWLYPWSEPVRVKQSFPVYEQQVWTAPIFPVVIPTITTTTSLSSPVFFNGRLIYQSVAKPVFVASDITLISKWNYPWSEPVRIKRGLPASEQQAFTAPPIFPNLNRLIQWYQALSEPVRQKSGIRSWLQQFFTAGTTPLPTNVTVVLNATETNNDVALFGVSVYNSATSAAVSIREIPAIEGAAASIEELPINNNAAASIEET